MPAEDSFDMVVIGSGPAGEKAAAQAAYFGKRVAVVEQSRVPGGAAVSNAPIAVASTAERRVNMSISFGAASAFHASR